MVSERLWVFRRTHTEDEYVRKPFDARDLIDCVAPPSPTTSRSQTAPKPDTAQ